MLENRIRSGISLLTGWMTVWSDKQLYSCHKEGVLAVVKGWNRGVKGEDVVEINSNKLTNIEQVRNRNEFSNIFQWFLFICQRWWMLNVCTMFQIPSRDADIPLLALSTCSSSSGNFKMILWFSSHFSARKWRSVVFWPMDLVSRSWKKKTKKHTIKYLIKRKKNNGSIQSFHQSFTFW